MSRRAEVRGVRAASERARTLHTRFLNSVKAVAIHERAGQSVTVKGDFKKYAPTGVGMRLEKVTGLLGVYVIGLVPGGAAWRANEIRVGDEIRMIDNMELGDMELPEVTRCIQGQAGTKVRLKGRRRGTRGKRSQRCCLIILYTHARARARARSLSLSRARAHTQIRLKILREDRDADGNVVDGVGYHFWSTIVRAPVDDSPNPQQMPEKPAETLEGWERVELAGNEVVSPAHCESACALASA